MGKVFILIGIISIIFGLLSISGVRIPFFGKLPGDFSVQGETFGFYFPLMTCLILSVILSVLVYLFSNRP